MSDSGTTRPEGGSPEGGSQAQRRLFLALWPGEELRRRLRVLLDEEVPIRSGRPEPLANLHVTLVFIGGVAADRVAPIEEAAAGVSGAAFDLILERVGYWDRPRILWLGPRSTPPALFALVRDLRAALAGCGMTPETRPYLPHMTLARKVTRPPAETIAGPLSWRVETYSLLESVPSDRGRVYRELAAWPLSSA
jgi:2'-5' RNA ligase